MAESRFNHLISIIFNSFGADKVVKDMNTVNDSLVKWDLKKHEDAAASFTKDGIGMIGTQAKNAGQSVEQLGSKTNDFVKAMRRALIVAPVWMALRSVMMSTLQGFASGFKYVEEFSSAMLKARAVTQDFGVGLDVAMSILEKRIRNLSRATGESMTSIAKSFYEFGTIGFSFQESWRGAEAATRFAMATQEDASKTAKTLAMTFKILGKTVDETVPPNEAMEVSLSKLYKLWQLNAGEAGDLTESLKAFLPTANTMGLSLDQTIALLSTLNSAALLGSRGGTLLRTSFSKLIDELPKLASELGIHVNPQLMTSYDVMRRVIDAIAEFGTTEKLPTAAQNIFSQVFGGVRGSEPVRALVALRDQLLENERISLRTYGESSDAVADYTRRIQEVTDSLPNQLKLFRELRTQIFESFIVGITGGKNFATVLKDINVIMENMANASKQIGTLLSGQGLSSSKWGNFFGSKLWEPLFDEMSKGVTQFDLELKQAIAGNLDLTKTKRFLVELEMGLDLSDPNNKKVVDQLRELVKNKTAKEGTSNKAAKDSLAIAQAHNDETGKTIEIYDTLIEKINLQKEESEDVLRVEKLRQLGLTEEDLALANLATSVNKMVSEYNNMLEVQNGQLQKLDAQQVLTLALQGNYADILKMADNDVGVHNKILDLAKEINKYELERLQIIGKQQEKYRNLYLEYEKGSDKQKEDIKRILELMTFAPMDLAGAFRNNDRDKELILQYWSNFSEVGQNAITQLIQFQNRLLAAPLDMTGNKYYNTLSGAQPTPAPAKETVPATTNNIATTNQFNIPVNVQGGITAEDVENVKKVIEEKLKASPNYIGEETIQKLVEELYKNPENRKKLASSLRTVI